MMDVNLATTLVRAVICPLFSARWYSHRLYVSDMSELRVSSSSAGSVATVEEMRVMQSSKSEALAAMWAPVWNWIQMMRMSRMK